MSRVDYNLKKKNKELREGNGIRLGTKKQVKPFKHTRRHLYSNARMEVLAKKGLLRTVSAKNLKVYKRYLVRTK